MVYLAGTSLIKQSFPVEMVNLKETKLIKLKIYFQF